MQAQCHPIAHSIGSTQHVYNMCITRGMHGNKQLKGRDAVGYRQVEVVHQHSGTLSSLCWESQPKKRSRTHACGKKANPLGLAANKARSDYPRQQMQYDHMQKTSPDALTGQPKQQC